MTIRTAVTVALAAALLAASLPAVERARVVHSDARVAGEAERLERAATALAAENDAVTDGGPVARTHVTIRLPERSWGDSGVVEFRVPHRDREPDIRWQVEGGEPRRRHVPDVRLVGADEGLALRAGGRHRLVVELRRDDGGRTVVVRRSTGSVAIQE